MNRYGINTVSKPAAMPDEEAEEYLRQELELWKAKGKELGRVEITLDGDEVVIKAYERSPIRRIRRITGYLSERDNFNTGKRAELDARVTHGTGGAGDAD